MLTPDVVVLVPGFLGFARLGGFYTFADRLMAALRGFLEEPLAGAVPVVPCTTLPGEALVRRQRHLLDSLVHLTEEKLRGVERIHLVGHSAGGVDAQLLACATPLEGGVWSRADERVRRRIRSVVTIAAPHYGTGLAESRLAHWGENPLRHPGVLFTEARTLLHLALILPREAAALVGLELVSPNDAVKFMLEVARHHELIADLRPAHMERLRATLEPDPGVSLTCFVTGTEVREDGERASDPFFRDLYGLTADSDGSGPTSAVVERCGRLLRRVVKSRPGLVIRSECGAMPAVIDVRLNDGVVNTIRQLVDPDDERQIGGFVVADHGDVLGHYDRQDALIDGPPYNAGLFHSGAGFGDDEFFTLYRRVANALLKSIPGAGFKWDPVPAVVTVQST